MTLIKVREDAKAAQQPVMDSKLDATPFGAENFGAHALAVVAGNAAQQKQMEHNDVKQIIIFRGWKATAIRGNLENATSAVRGGK